MQSLRTLAPLRRLATASARQTQKAALSSLAANQASPFRPAACQMAGRRWYSDVKADESSKTADGTGDAAPSAEPTELGELKKKLEARDKEVIDLKDKYLRSVADFRNLQERIKRETQAARDFAIQKFAKDLVESVDNFDRALSMVTDDKLVPKSKTDGMGSDEAAAVFQTAHSDLLSLHEGLRMTEKILMQTLAKHGLVRVEPTESEKFDPNVHEATFQAPQPGKEDGTVFFTQQKGFVLNGRTLRAAKVGVVKNS